MQALRTQYEAYDNAIIPSDSDRAGRIDSEGSFFPSSSLPLLEACSNTPGAVLKAVINIKSLRKLFSVLLLWLR